MTATTATTPAEPLVVVTWNTYDIWSSQVEYLTTEWEDDEGRPMLQEEAERAALDDPDLYTNEWYSTHDSVYLFTGDVKPRPVSGKERNIPMSQMNKISSNNTRVYVDEAGYTCVKLHQTVVVRFNAERIYLNTGGWRTVTTKARMNQTSNQFGLGYRVYSKDYEWFVTFSNADEPLRFSAGGRAEIIRNPNTGLPVFASIG